MNAPSYPLRNRKSCQSTALHMGGALVFKLNEDIAFKEVDGNLVLLNLTSGFYYSLNETATLIYRLLRKNKSRSEILQELCTAYGVSEDTARRDLEDCLESLVREQVLLKQEE